MTQVRVNPTSTSKLPMALAIAAAIAGAVYWWSPSGTPSSPSAPSTPSAPLGTGQISSATTAPLAAQDNSPVAVSSASEAEMAAFLKEQQAVDEIIAKNPVLEPIVGPVTNKPAFLSVTEWTMLTAVAQQQTSPEKALNSLVNTARFNKQLEHWEGLSKAAPAGVRLALSNQLLDELPQHVLDGNMDLPTAVKLQGSLLVDVVQDPNERKRRAATEAKRLVLPPPESPADKH